MTALKYSTICKNQDIIFQGLNEFSSKPVLMTYMADG
jgi:hypothetical protein